MRMLHNNVFTYCKASGFEKKEKNYKLLGNIFIHIAARLRLSPQMAELCKERIDIHQVYDGLKCTICS